MKPRINLPKSSFQLALAFFTIFCIAVNQANAKNLKSIVLNNLSAGLVSTSDQVGNMQLAVPIVPLQKNKTHVPEDTKKESQHDDMKDDMKKGKTHADEEKHKNHLYHYSRVKRKKRSHTAVICLALKLFIAISYLSVLICTYLSLCH